MGYDLHITRRKNWFEKGNDITSDEWLSFVANDPELKLEPKVGPFFAIWNGLSNLESPWLDWTGGQIQTKNPDNALIDKMLEIAHKLGAGVQGDDGEIYRSARDAHKTPKRSPYTLLRFSLIIGGVILYFIFVELIMYSLYHRFDSNSSWPLLIALVPWAIIMMAVFLVFHFRSARRRKPGIPQMKLGEILPASEMKAKYDLTTSKYQPHSLNPENVPEELQDLTSLAQKWGIGDDIIRDDLHQKASQEEKQALAIVLRGRVKAINLWLDSFERGKMSKEAAAFMFMLEGLDEMGLYPHE